MITEEQVWKGPDAVRRDVAYADDVTDEIRFNIANTTRVANLLLSQYTAATGKTVDRVNSGWRPPAVNESTSNAAKASKHLLGLAVDLYDPHGDLDKWLMTDDGLDALVELDLWIEHPGWTDGWSHLQTVPAGNPPNPNVRVYIPSRNPPATKIYGQLPVYRMIA